MKKYNVNGVEFFDWKGKPYCTINQCGVEATYPFEKPNTKFPIQAVLMDLDGTTVISEEFWILTLSVVAEVLIAGIIFIENPNLSVASKSMVLPRWTITFFEISSA